MRRKLLFIAWVLAAGWSAWAHAATFYVDPGCAHNGDGTAEACAGAPAGVGAFNTWAGLSYAAGNSYLQKRGTTYSGMLQMATGGSGSADANRVFIGAYGDGERPKINGAGEQMAVRLDGTIGYITISDLEVYGVDAVASHRDLLRLCNVLCTDIHLDNLVLHDPVDPGGVNEANGIWGQCYDCTFDNLTIYNIPSDGIWLNNIGNFTLTNSHIYNVATSLRGTGDGVQLQGIAEGQPGVSITILDNIIDHSSISAKAALNDSSGSPSGVISGNTFYMSNNQDQNLSKNVTLYSNNLRVIRNRFVGGWRCLNHNGTGYLIYGNVITGCFNIGYIAEGNLSSRDTVTYFINNTVEGLNDQIAKAPYCAYVDHFSTGTIGYFYANIFTNCDTGVAGTATTSVPNSKNLFYGTLTAGSGTWVTGPNTLSGTNPSFINGVIDGDFRTQAGSPARRAGISGYPCADVRGRACYPDRPDIGAYQSSSGDPAATRAVRN